MKIFSPLISFVSKIRKRRELGKKGLVQARKRLRQDETLGQAVEKSRTIGIFILIAVWCVCVAILVIPVGKDSSFFLVENQQVQSTVFADFTFSYVDEERTKISRENARNLEPAIYKIDLQACKSSMELAAQFFDELSKRISMEEKSSVYEKNPENKASCIVDALSNETVASLLPLVQSPDKKKILMDQLELVLYQGVINMEERDEKRALRIQIFDDTGKKREKIRSFRDILTPLQAAWEVTDNVSRYYSPQDGKALKRALDSVLAQIITGNLSYDINRTEENRQIAAEAVVPVKVEIKKGDVIIEKGKIVGEKDQERFQAYQKEKKEREGISDFWHKFINNAFICLLLMVLNGIYISHIHPEVIKSNQKMGLIGTVVILTIMANFLAIKAFYILGPVFNLSPILIPTVLPIAMASVLLSVMIGLRVGLYAGLFVALIAALQLDNSFHIVLSGMVVSSIAGFSVRHSPNHRSYFLRIVLMVSLTIPFMELTHLWNLNEKMLVLFWGTGLGIANGIIIGAFSLALLFILESIFQISTDMSLLLLSDYNHPLLKRLQLEALGTYHHSLLVSTLAEQAAQSIGANPIRARVCALFHDIGKLTKPEYFVENNMGEKSKHDELNPKMSCLIILNHVKDGVDMAIKHKLRKVIRDAIEQHHGTDLVLFFYKRAVEETDDNDIPVEENEYRYPGPLPREKEVVLVSLADTCEAASRTLQKPTPAKIDSLIWEVFRRRIRDGQLNAAELTFGELAKVRQSFVKTLTTMLHSRVAYPKEEDEHDESDLFQIAQKIPASSKAAPLQNADNGG